MSETLTEPRGGAAIDHLCREQGRVKGWVAKQLGIPQDRLSRLINGERELTLAEAAKLAEIFSVPIETFLPVAS